MQNFGVTKAKSIVVCYGMACVAGVTPHKASYGIFCSDQYKKSRKIFYQQDDNGEFWMKVLIVTFLDVVNKEMNWILGIRDTADVLTASRDNVKLVETRTVHFARLK